VRSDAYLVKIRERRATKKIKGIRPPKGSLKMSASFVTPSRSSLWLLLRRRAAESSHF